MDIGIGYAIAAIGALGTAAFGLVDCLKLLLPSSGLANAGYPFIEQGVAEFFPRAARKTAAGDLRRLFDTLHGNWVNGRALADQKAIAKSLIKLRLDATTAPRFAFVTGVDPVVLTEVGRRMTNGTPLDPQHTNALGRFDLGLAAVLDDAYQHADQRYRNSAKTWAMGVAVLLALAGGWLTFRNDPDYMLQMGKALLAGLVATSIAPMAKDLASALQAGVKVAESIRK